VEDRLTLPLHWKRPRKIFVNSQSDLFHEDVSFEVIDRAFAVMALCPQHTFQILTKRPDRMLEYLKNEDDRVNAIEARAGEFGACHCNIACTRERWPLPNVWLGTSVENQKAVDLRIPDLIVVPAAVRFLSCEPLLGGLDVAKWLVPDEVDCGGYDPAFKKCLDWIIAGGESGPLARPMHPDWVRGLRDQCVAAGVPFFFKQWGEWAEFVANGGRIDGTEWLTIDGKILVGDSEADTDALVGRIGKARAGRMLDGCEWNEMPSVRAEELAA
jgi:protein gp37